MCLGTPGQIVAYLDDARQLAQVDFAGTLRTVNTGMVAEDADPPGPGDWVLVHMGMALQRMDPEEARSATAFFDDMLADFERVAAERHDQTLAAERHDRDLAASTE